MKHDVEHESGFTLVEMLVVIAVIAILAALLFPVLSAAKNRAGRATCSNNLRQISLGVRMYADDSNDKLPRRAKGQNVCSFYKAYCLVRGIDYTCGMKKRLDQPTVSSDSVEVLVYPRL